MKCVVLLPGIMGTALQLDGAQIWPPSIGEMIHGYDRIAQLLSTKVVHGGIIRNVSFFGVYKSLLQDIEDCGYTTTSKERRFIPFGYDWRRSNAVSAAKLADHFDVEFSGVEDLEITLMGHSMGGLVLRYLLESGDFRDRKWFGKIKTLITLATPHFGAPTALAKLRGLESSTSVSGPDVQKLGAVDEYSALYELVPPESSALTVTPRVRGKIQKKLNPFSSGVIAKYKLSGKNVKIAEEFWKKLNLGNRPDGIEYFFFAGSTHETRVRNHWLSGAGELDPVSKKQSGDGTVPFVSAAVTGIPHGYSSKKHQAIFTDRNLREALFDFLDAPANAKPHSAEESELPVGASEAIGLSVNKDTFANGEPIEVAISYVTEQTDPSEAFGILKIDPETEGTEVVKSVTIRFEGVALKNFTFTLVAELQPGAYELKSNRDVDDPEPTMFFVTEEIYTEEQE